jgi:FkbM family methyltransferase
MKRLVRLSRWIHDTLHDYAMPETFTTSDGIAIPMRELPLSSGAKRRICNGGYETHERMLVTLLLKPGEHVLELGASLGIVSSLILKAIGPSGRLVAVEADAKLAVPFHRQLGANSLSCELVNCLCWPIWTSAVPSTLSGRMFVQGGTSLEGRASTGDAASTSSVEWKTASQICEENSLNPTAIVCDIEGAEEAWVTHASSIPSNVRTLIVELHPWISGPTKTGAILSSLRVAGFEAVAVSGTVFGLQRTASLAPPSAPG